MVSRFRIRAATRADLEQIAAIERDVFSDPWPASAFVPLLALDAFVAEAGGAVAGYIFARSVADEAEVLNLAVRAESRRAGVGQGLLDAVLELLRERSVATVYLEVRASNAEAQAFYRSLGFRQLGVRREYYSQPAEDALVLARDISQSKDAK